MAENGFLTRQLFGLRERWDSKSITDLMDSYGQEWVSVRRRVACLRLSLCRLPRLYRCE